MEFRDPFSQAQSYSQPQAAAGFDAGLRAYMLKIYNYMTSALALTGIVAFITANSPALLSAFFAVGANGQMGMTGLGWIVFLAPLGLVLWLSFGLNRMSAQTAQIIYWVYAALLGLSLSPILLAYTGASVAQAFFVTAGTFGAMSIYGYTTKRDLTGVGHFLRMGVIGLFIALAVSFFFSSPGFSFALSIIGVGIFVGLTAYDTQKLKALYYQMGGSGEMAAKITVIGALTLYLDFINIFLFLIRIMGNRR